MAAQSRSGRAPSGPRAGAGAVARGGRVGKPESRQRGEREIRGWLSVGEEGRAAIHQVYRATACGAYDARLIRLSAQEGRNFQIAVAEGVVDLGAQLARAPAPAPRPGRARARRARA